MQSIDAELIRVGCVLLASGSVARVIAQRGAFDQFKELDGRQKAQLLARMTLWSDGRHMPSEHFNANEGRCRKGDINRLLQAFKVHKVRLFGFVRPFANRKTFIVVDIDPAKKQDRANRRILARATDRVISFEEAFGEIS